METRAAHRTSESVAALLTSSTVTSLRRSILTGSVGVSVTRCAFQSPVQQSSTLTTCAPSDDVHPEGEAVRSGLRPQEDIRLVR
ncbi:hypothetical protein GCM10010305_48100 [Streptomyces termitum]|uniref:Uncharacterized protein n=1 Tax=Streptomyces termitum TaxID=67368 RepID=A0A918WCL4_9ACTN|nr:hypothetical protein GCM10010305_48100 [Streptomyces termitum]